MLDLDFRGQYHEGLVKQTRITTFFQVSDSPLTPRPQGDESKINHAYPLVL